MWPRLVGRGNDGPARHGGSPRAASMWPRLVGRGNLTHAGRRYVARLELQCGRGWLAAETRGTRRRRSGPGRCFNVAAAGWPRKPTADHRIAAIRSLQCGRGWLAAETSRRRGWTWRPASFNVAAAGWPRKPAPAASDGLSLNLVLQCGRGWLAAETGRHLRYLA